jgi:hypothetical protein
LGERKEKKFPFQTENKIKKKSFQNINLGKVKSGLGWGSTPQLALGV